MMDENPETRIEERLTKLEKEIKTLVKTLEAWHESLEKSRKEQMAFHREEMDRILNRLLDGTKENPGILKSLDDIKRILDERLPKPEK